MKYFLIFVLFSITLAHSQSIVKESTKIVDSVDYYLEVADFNREEKKSFNKAIIYTEKAIAIAKSDRLNKKLPDCYLSLGKIYQDIEKYDLAIEYFIRSINLYPKNNTNTNLASAYYNISICNLEKDKIEIAQNYLNKAAEIYQEIEFEDAIELINLQRAIILKQKNDYGKAIPILKNIVEAEENNTYFYVQKEAYFQLGQIENSLKNPLKAIEYYKKGLVLNNYKTNFKLQQKILKQLSQTYRKQNNLVNSQLYLEKYVAISDSILHFHNINLSNTTLDKIQFDKQVEKIAQLDKDRKSQERTIRFSKLVTILSFGFITILSLLSFSLYKNNKIKKKINAILNDKNKELIIEKEKAIQASKARSEFLGTVSHELRTPLNAINGITYLLLNEKPKQNQLNYLKSLEFSGHYLLNFINDILEINRLESDKVLVDNIPFNVKDLVTNIVKSLHEFSIENNTKVAINIEETIDTNIIGDPTKLSQVLINLLNNAIKFSKNGEVIISITKKSENLDFVNLIFEVKDTGIGIPEELQKNIFDSFSQGSVEINRNYGGTGLGLSIVKKILEILDSKIQLSSKENQGSTFKFKLKYKKNLEQFTIKKLITPKVDLEKNNLSTKKILLVEDNKINQMITQKMLQSKGMDCVIIGNGEEAIENVKENKYDLILMDVHLPGINGTIATEEIRKFNTSVPIIALTAISLNENKEMLLSFGMNEVITKPFKPEIFFAIITDFLVE